MEHESEQKVSYGLAMRLLLVLRTHWQLGGSRGEQQTVARVNLGPEVGAILLRILSGSTCGNPEILGDEVLPKCFEKN